MSHTTGDTAPTRVTAAGMLTANSIKARQLRSALFGAFHGALEANARVNTTHTNELTPISQANGLTGPGSIRVRPRRQAWRRLGNKN